MRAATIAVMSRLLTNSRTNIAGSLWEEGIERFIPSALVCALCFVDVA